LPPVSQTLSRIGVVVHPTRSIETPMNALRRWSGERGIELVQVPAPCKQREVAARGSATECDLVMAIGGDGTTLAAIRTAAAAACPVFGVACGSLGVLTSVAANGVVEALDRFEAGNWQPRELPALDVARDGATRLMAINDIAIVRAAEGQVFVTARIDGVLAVRLAGDGCVVSTATGSSGYSLAAGGPLLALDSGGFLLTPLSVHGGSCPPIVLEPHAELTLETRIRYGGARLEVDGQVTREPVGLLTVRLRPAVATVVSFADQEPFLSRLRRRRIIIDSPRILAEDEFRGGLS
jgi:NAD+ kinase